MRIRGKNLVEIFKPLVPPLECPKNNIKPSLEYSAVTNTKNEIKPYLKIQKLPWKASIIAKICWKQNYLKLVMTFKGLEFKWWAGVNRDSTNATKKDIHHFIGVEPWTKWSQKMELGPNKKLIERSKPQTCEMKDAPQPKGLTLIPGTTEGG
jgi:hypothetical protein